MGSMADAVNAPEKKTEVSETLSHGATSVEETVPGQVALPALDFPVNPKSPTELKDDQAGDEEIWQSKNLRKRKLASPLKRRWGN